MGAEEDRIPEHWTEGPNSRRLTREEVIRNYVEFLVEQGCTIIYPGGTRVDLPANLPLNLLFGQARNFRVFSKMVSE